jgi:hypothetical protein
MEEVKDYLGHSSIRVTSDRYADLFPHARASIADALDARFHVARETSRAQIAPKSQLAALPNASEGR